MIFHHCVGVMYNRACGMLHWNAAEASQARSQVIVYDEVVI